jgi:hypothetical protein
MADAIPYGGNMLKPPIFLLCIAFAASLGAAASRNAEAAVQLAPPGLSALSPPGQLLLTFDNLGNGTIFVGGGSGTSLPGSLMDDPADPSCPATCTPVLTYLLPPSEPVISGDVAILTESGNEIADWLRFTDDAGTISGASTGMGGRMIFYFETPFAENIGSENFIVGPTEVIADGTASFDYQPAGVAYPANNEFIGSQAVAPAVPEPSTLALLGSGIAALCCGAIRVRGARQSG